MVVAPWPRFCLFLESRNMVHAMREESVDIFVSVWTFLTCIMQTSGDLDP